MSVQSYYVVCTYVVTNYSHLPNKRVCLLFFTFLKAISLFSRSFSQNILSLCTNLLAYKGVLVYYTGQSKVKEMSNKQKYVWHASYSKSYQMFL